MANGKYIDVMRHTIALNGAFSNAQRMMGQYLRNAYRLSGQAVDGG